MYYLIFGLTIRALYPEHEIFSQEQDWVHLIPFYLHGDGGRTYKTDAMILTMFSAFGGHCHESSQAAASARKGPFRAPIRPSTMASALMRV